MGTVKRFAALVFMIIISANLAIFVEVPDEQPSCYKYRIDCILPRYLEVKDQMLVKEKPTPEAIAAYMQNEKLTYEQVLEKYGVPLDLSGRDLRWANLEKIRLPGAKMHNANLQGAKMYEANLQDANIRWANLQGADMQEVKLGGADSWGSNLSFADLRGADFKYERDKKFSLPAKYDYAIFDDASPFSQGGKVKSPSPEEYAEKSAEYACKDPALLKTPIINGMISVIYSNNYPTLIARALLAAQCPGVKDNLSPNQRKELENIAAQ